MQWYSYGTYVLSQRFNVIDISLFHQFFQYFCSSTFIFLYLITSLINVVSTAFFIEFMIFFNQSLNWIFLDSIIKSFSSVVYITVRSFSFSGRIPLLMWYYQFHDECDIISITIEVDKDLKWFLLNLSWRVSPTRDTKGLTFLIVFQLISIRIFI